MNEIELITEYQKVYAELVAAGFTGWELEDALEDAAMRLMGFEE